MSYLSFETLQFPVIDSEPALFLLDIAVKATAILLATVALNIALRRASAATRHLLWSISLSALLALPLLTYALPSWRVAVLPESFSISDNRVNNLESETASQPKADAFETRKASRNYREPAITHAAASGSLDRSGENRAAPQEESYKPAETIAPASTEAFHWSYWVLMIWLAGFLISSGRLILGIATVWRLSRKASEITDQTWTALTSDISRQLCLQRRVALLKSSRIAMPQTWGALRPAVLLPAEADNWTIERRRVVLMHELAHVKRKDWLTQVMAQTACAYYWFNPLVWMAARRLRMERELACDDQVLEKGTRASDYANVLLDIARSLHSGSCSSLTAVAMARQSQLEGRLLAILNPSLNRKGLNRIGSSLLVVALALVVLPLASLRPTAQSKASSQDGVQKLESIERVGKQSQMKFEKQISNASKLEAETETEGRLQESEDEPETEVTAEQEQPESEEPSQQEQKSSEQSTSGAIEALKDALKDQDSQVRAEAIFALAQVDGAASVEALKKALSDSDWRVRKQAAWGLGMKGDQGSVDSLITALRDQHADVRAEAAWALGMKGDRSAVEPMVAALKDEDVRVRSQAAWALGMKGDSRSVDGLIAALQDSSAQVRSQAAWALGMKGDGRSVDAMIAALKDASAQVRSQAAWGLGMKGARRAIEPLSAAMKDENRQVRQQAAWALGMLLIKAGDVKIDVKIDPKEIDRELGSIDADVDPEEEPDPEPARPRRRARPDRNIKDK
jgi:HEAT repeat protein/beta-lactamase regulating signal transducer with metallopeptidase domain